MVEREPDVTFVLREVPEHEQFLMRTEGGPFPGDRIVDSRDWVWPLPLFLDVPGEFEGSEGRYVKVSESALTDEQMALTTHVIRGARYEWRPSTVEDGGSTAHEGQVTVGPPEVERVGEGLQEQGVGRLYQILTTPRDPRGEIESD